MTPARTDCLVIGAGAAGAVYAVQAARAGLHVTLITGARELTASNSLWAQGGIIYDVNDHGDGDLLRADIDAASGHSANPAAVDAIVRDGPRLVRELLIDDLQVAFDRDAEGALQFTREASHSRHRIIYAKDHTGRAILTALHERLTQLAAAGTLPGGGSLTVATGCFAVDLLTLSHSSVDFLDRYRPLSCIGAHVLDVAAGEARPIMAKKTVLATGGLGQVYLHSTNDAGAYGHGVAMAYRVGARVIDMEYVQFHPTVFHRRGERPFLISEAVRGEGGVLINRQGEAFMERYHPDGSLAPRDVISRSIHSELLRGASDTVYIDLAAVDADYARRRFPTINARLLAAGVDMTREPIPVVPAAHYSCGGIHTDMAGNTNIAHLSAIGETACTGLHGANRLASTSLLECLVMGATAAGRHAAEIAAGADFHLPAVRPWEMASAEPDDELITQDLNVIRNTMWNYVGLVRTAKRLDRAGNLLRELKNEIDGFYADNALTPRLLALRNAVQTALLITYAALRNPRSTGCHYRKRLPRPHPPARLIRTWRSAGDSRVSVVMVSGVTEWPAQAAQAAQRPAGVRSCGRALRRLCDAVVGWQRWPYIVAVGIDPALLAEFDAAARRPLALRWRYAFVRTYKPVLDDAEYRSFDTMEEYRQWCEQHLPDWLGYGRVRVPPS